MHRNNISVANMTFKKTSKRKLEWHFWGMISVLNSPHEHNIQKTPLRSIRFSWSSRGYDLSGVSPKNQQTTAPNIQPAIKKPYENTISSSPDCNMGNSLVVYNCIMVSRFHFVFLGTLSTCAFLCLLWSHIRWLRQVPCQRAWGLLFHKEPPRFFGWQIASPNFEIGSIFTRSQTKPKEVKLLLWNHAQLPT